MDYRGNGGRMRIEYKGGTMRNCLPMNCQHWSIMGILEPYGGSECIVRHPKSPSPCPPRDKK